MHDYQGHGKATQPLLPMIGIPTTAGTGSEAQTYALISDAESLTKMACGDPDAAFRIALLDPVLTVSQPPVDHCHLRFRRYCSRSRNVRHSQSKSAVGSFLARGLEACWTQTMKCVGATGRTSRRVVRCNLGAYFAGVAIENSMLGATHACANPLTARFGTAHGAAIAMLLPSVVRWNDPVGRGRYEELSDCTAARDRLSGMSATEGLARRLEELATAGGLRRA